jgi:outer membrane protein OmpA-like peptidoglycan-associated protein
MKKVLIILPLLLLMLSTAYSQSSDKIHWYSFEEAVKLNQIKPKKVFIDIFTDWCGWCKQLDKTTFTDPVIIKLMNENFYAVKLNAERKDTVVFNGYAFINPNPAGPRSVHQLASSMLKGRMMYPSMVFMDDSMRIISTVQSYLKPQELEPILAYIGRGNYKTMTYDTFKLSYKIEAKDVSTETKPFVLNKVIFDPGKTILKASSYPQLDSMVTVLKGNVEIKFDIAGYTDNTGNEAANKSLSEQRAKAVYDYFVSKGIEAGRMTYTGYGSLNPVADNTTADGQKLNRRIEIKFLDK